MNKPRCQFDKRKNCVCFACCSPSPVQKATPKPAVKGDLSFTLPLTAEFWAALQTKATGSKSKRTRSALHQTNCSPEQKKKNRCAVCGNVGDSHKAVYGCGWTDTHGERGLAPLGVPYTAPVGLCVANTLGSVSCWVLLPQSHLSITGGYLLTELTEIKIKRRNCYGKN